jgi:hypothetical protein
MAGRGGPVGDLGQGMLGTVKEGVFFEKVSGRVAAQGEFGKEDQVGARLLRAGGEFEDRARVPGKVPNGWIDLSQRDLHRMSLPRCGEDRSDVRRGCG